jgi:putative metallohydrolase (TIGR04338 family)
VALVSPLSAEPDSTRPEPRPRDRRSAGRDTQRAALYSAQHTVHAVLDRAASAPLLDIAGSRISLPTEKRFASLSSVQTYVDAVLRLNFVRARWRRAAVPVTVRERSGSTSAHYERSNAVLAIPGVTRGTRWALRELVVLHELAHHLEEDASAPAHGPAFAGRFIALVEDVVAVELALVLRVTFAEAGVEIS